MPITQIPFQDPVAPPKPPPAEQQLGLYDAQGWESAYRDMDDAHVPHLLIQLQDDLARSRRREAAWISIITHIVLILLVLNIEKLEKYFPRHSVIVVSPNDVTRDKDVTFLALPPDAQKLSRKSNTNVISDKDRIATSRHPQLDPKELRKILATPPPGAPGPNGPRMPQPAAPSAPAAAQNQQPQQQTGQEPMEHPPSDANQLAKLQLPAKPKPSFKLGGAMSAGSAIQEAIRGAATQRGGGG